MPFRTVVISPRRDFSELASVTDGWVPARGVWVGDYPYLRRAEFASLCKSLRIFSGTTTTSRSSSRSSGGKSQVDWKNKDSADVSIDDPENLDPSDSDGNNNRGFNQGGDRGGDRGDGVSDSPYRSEYEAFDELDTEIINYSEDDYSSDINYSDDINSVEYEGKGDIEGDDDEGDLTDVEVVSMTAKRVRVIDRKNEYNDRPLRRIRPVEERS